MHEVPQIILQQLGGRRFQVMTGANSFVGGENYLSMRVPNARHGEARVTHVRVTLDPSDTYTVEAFRCSARAANLIKVIASESAIYCDDLQESFTRLTGLYTHL